MSDINSIESALLNNSSASTSTGAFKQQTFLGASVLDFNVSAGFGESSSSLSVNLLSDAHNVGDETGQGLGDDVYHNGVADSFIPPPVGSPVFFKFGTEYVTMDAAFRKTLDDTYPNFTTSSTFANNAGHFHFVFGGLLQAINESKGADGNPRYSVQVVDPREVLSNVQLILNNYSGTTFNNKNMFNLYGFLEYNLPLSIEQEYTTKDPLRSFTNINGRTNYIGTDMYMNSALSMGDILAFNAGNIFPMTGTGFSRRSKQGIPFYRVNQALNALFQMNRALPSAYANAGFGGYINFRGYNYVVDLSGLPLMDQFYFIDYDQISLLDLCLEVCEVTNHEMLISLLPITSHPSCSVLHAQNNSNIANNNMEGVVAGIIRIDTINRSVAQPAGSIQNYLDNLDTDVTSKNLGIELSNVNTDKFVVGANEVEMYYFSGNSDRLTSETRTQWSLEHSFSQQILPYYGKLPGNSDVSETVSIPKGYGSYQQILLDSSKLNAIGVGNFYVATEIELRAALVSFERWKDFLLHYENIYMESTEMNDVEEGIAIVAQPDFLDGDVIPGISNNYAVTVPRSVWPTDEEGYDTAGLPLSPCNPPYGYPLYWKRAQQIGLPTQGAGNIGALVNRLLENAAESNINAQQMAVLSDSIVSSATANEFKNPLTDTAKNILDKVNQGTAKLSEEFVETLSTTIRFYRRSYFKNLSNAKKVYDFVRSVADECLGKKFLVKIPRQVNVFYDNIITQNDGFFVKGPFGFRPNILNADPKYSLGGTIAAAQMKLFQGAIPLRSFLVRGETLVESEDGFTGALEVEFNPISSKYEFNYEPEPNGGFYEYDLLSNFSSHNQPLHVAQGLAPQDPTIFNNGDSRISAYVRFDNSQNLSFSNFSVNDITQQVAVNDHFVPDLNYTLDNLTTGRPKDIPPLDTAKPKAITFVKATLDSKFYMAPASRLISTNVHGRLVKQTPVLSRPRQVFDEEQCKNVDAMRYMRFQHEPLPQTDGYKSNVRTFVGEVAFGQQQYAPDTDHVYALITLPNRVTPTVDSRLRDGQLQQYNTVQVKHAMAADVVKGVDGFQKPAVKGTPTALLDLFTGDEEPDANVMDMINQARGAVSFALPNKIEFTSPSPVYPDLVALPLSTKDRCYGPWLSSQIGTTSNIGGKVEYIKDENLAPWNYSGYDLMNRAGVVKAQFSNSLLLQSERGSFSIPNAPSGIALGKALLNNGPLVSNISVSVSTAGVTTDYKLELYTPSFGKLKKQRLDNISKIARNQQKLEDERNALIRKGFGKNQIGQISFAAQQNAVINNLLRQTNSSSTNATDSQANKNPPATDLTISVIEHRDPMELEVGEGALFGANANNNYLNKRILAASNISQESMSEVSDVTQDDSNLVNRLVYNTASSKASESHSPVSLEPGHPNMPSIDVTNVDAINRLKTEEDNIKPEDISDWNKDTVRRGSNELI